MSGQLVRDPYGLGWSDLVQKNGLKTLFLESVSRLTRPVIPLLNTNFPTKMGSLGVTSVSLWSVFVHSGFVSYVVLDTHLPLPELYGKSGPSYTFSYLSLLIPVGVPCLYFEMGRSGSRVSRRRSVEPRHRRPGPGL